MSKRGKKGVGEGGGQAGCNTLEHAPVHIAAEATRKTAIISEAIEIAEKNVKMLEQREEAFYGIFFVYSFKADNCSLTI